MLGRKVQQTDPDTRTTTFQYNAFGELIGQINAAGQRMEHEIDARVPRPVIAGATLVQVRADPVGGSDYTRSPEWHKSYHPSQLRKTSHWRCCIRHYYLKFFCQPRFQWP